MTKPTMAHLRDLVRRLGIGAAQVAGLPEAFAPLKHMEWSNGWQDELLEAAHSFPACLDNLLEASARLAEAVKLPVRA